MTKTLIPVDPATFDASKVPAIFGTYDDTEAADLANGVLASYAVVSIRGKVFRVKQGENEQTLQDKDGNPRTTFPMVIVGWSKYVSKTYYKSAYKSGSDVPPDCRSMDGVRPDPDVPEPVNSVCATCPKNQWGSATTDNGSRAKACGDGRRIAVVPAWDLANEAFDGPMLLRVPTMSLDGLKAFGQQLKDLRLPLRAAVVQTAFDPNNEYQKLTFKLVAQIGDAEDAKVIMDHAKSARVAEMLNPPVPPAAAPAAAGNVVPLRAADVPVQPAQTKPSANVQKAEVQPAPAPEAVAADMEDLLAGFDKAPAKASPPQEKAAAAAPDTPEVAEADAEVDEAIAGLLDGFDMS